MRTTDWNQGNDEAFGQQLMIMKPILVVASLLLLFDLSTPTSCAAQEIFSDGFETGDTTSWVTVGAFSPSDLENLWGWWDAGSEVSVFNGLVDQWNDQSGNNRHWTQSSETNRPKYVPLAHADRPTIEWSPDNQAWLELADSINPAGNDIELFVVARTSPDPVDASLVQQDDGQGLGRAWIYSAGNDLRSYIGGVPIDGVGVVDIFDVNVYHVRYDDSAQTLELFKNGDIVNTFNNVAGESCLGGLMLGRSKTENFFEGYMYEIVIYDRALTADERGSVTTYLQQKWKTVQSDSSMLPSDIEDLWGWWRADAGIIIGIGGVSHWLDQSGNDLTLQQTIFDRRPQYNAGVQNGLPGLLFDNIDDQLENLNDTLDFVVEDGTIFVVVNTQKDNACVIAGLDGPVGIGRAWFENEPGYGRVYIGGFPDAPLSLEGGGVLGLSILNVYFNQTQQISQYGVDGWIWGVATNVIPEPNPDGGFRVGNGKYDVNELDGYIHEVVIFDRALTWAERQRIFNYLNNRWGVY